MNPVLASIYGTHEKVASASDELDLNNISAAELLYLLEEEESEKVANDELDLSQLSARELVELMEQAEELESEEAEKVALEKMAQDGSFDYFDMAGRIMAHAYANEMDKVASGLDDEIEVDLDSISGEDLLELMEAGYEFDGAEKVAAPSKGMTSRLGRAITERVGALRRMKGKREAEIAKAVRQREFKKMRKMLAGKGEHGDVAATKELSDKRSLPLQRRAASMRGSQFERNVGRSAIGAGVGLGALGTAGGVYAMRRKKSEK